MVANAKVRLAQVVETGGDRDAAERLYRAVVAWSEEPRPHTSREALFFVLAGSPATRALLALAELAEASGDSAAASELRARAELALA